MKIITRSSYILCTFILLFSIVHADGDIFVRSASYTSSKNRVMVVCFHMKLRSPSSASIYSIIYVVQSFSFSAVAIDLHGHLNSHRALMTFMRILTSNCNARITLMLQRPGYARLYLKRRLYEVSMESNNCS